MWPFLPREGSTLRVWTRGTTGLVTDVVLPGYGVIFRQGNVQGLL